MCRVEEEWVRIDIPFRDGKDEVDDHLTCCTSRRTHYPHLPAKRSLTTRLDVTGFQEHRENAIGVGFVDTQSSEDMGRHGTGAVVDSDLNVAGRHLERLKDSNANKRKEAGRFVGDETNFKSLINVGSVNCSAMKFTEFPGPFLEIGDIPIQIICLN
jgi:hypothetical protein